VRNGTIYEMETIGLICSKLKCTLSTVNVVFKTNVPNELIPINPLGLVITYFREDEAFN
jgi:hypothetical protein